MSEYQAGDRVELAHFMGNYEATIVELPFRTRLHYPEKYVMFSDKGVMFYALVEEFVRVIETQHA